MGKRARPTEQADSEKGPDKSFKTLVKNSIWAYKVMFQLSKKDTIILFVSSIMTAVFPVISSYTYARFIDEVVKLMKSGVSSIYELELTSPLIILLLIGTAVIFLNRFFGHVNDFTGERFYDLHFDLFNVELLTRISKLDIKQFEDPEISNDIRKARDNSYKVIQFASNSVNVLIDITTVVISGIIAFSVSPLISGLIILLSIPNNIIYARFIKEIWNYYNNSIERNRTFWWIASSLTDEQMMPEHKVTNSHHYISKFIMDLRKALSTESINIRKKRFVGSIYAILLNSITFIITPLFLISRMLTGTMSIGQFTFKQGQFNDFSQTIDKMLGGILQLSDSATYITYVRNIFEISPAIKSGIVNIPENKSPRIEFKNVSFRYPKSKKFALQNINMTIEPGEEIAIVGENGAGKTTLIKLLLRFYDPTEGQILVDGKPLETLDLDRYHDVIGALFQEYSRYEPLTVKENITIGDYRANVTQDKLEEAANQADARDFIEKLERKYDTKLAKQFKNGTNLSTGQWQKLALARMFYRDRPVLILDEPTASIDAEAEFRIFKRIYSFMKNKTIIIISHRFSTVRNAHKIYVLNKGRIVEMGSHEELMKGKGLYKRAFNLQAKGYQKTNNEENYKEATPRPHHHDQA